MSQALPLSSPLALTTRSGDRIAIVQGLRTPFARQATAFHGIPAVELGNMVVSELLARSNISPDVIDQLVLVRLCRCPKRRILHVKSC